ncbi:MAG TPA: phosphoribosylglycinamide synthetase C domain-containing protein [Roseiflexaceae bacterium]|nr:phosphoribosylglycinamide synthetase C domain-containing protein [Roseiflexaceae bacterium]
MKVLVLGGDGRAHALVWKLFNSPLAEEVMCAPGNGGTSQIAPSVDLALEDAANVARWAFEQGVDIIVPAEGGPLQHGMVDEVISFHIGVCGPSQRSTALERSRCRAKEFMLRYNLPTAPGRAFTSLSMAEKFLASMQLPVMIKADHPAGGEAVYHDRYAALAGLRDLFAARTIDETGNGVVIEQFLEGPRVVLSTLTDGHTAVPLLATRLYDRINADKQSPLAAGVGAHTSTSRYATLLTDFLHHKCIMPVLGGLSAEGMPVWGVLGIDCIITAQGPCITAIRYSMHEGEAQVVLPRMEDDLLPWVQATIARRIHDMPALRWRPVASVGIGLYARGYPYHFPVGGPISSLDTLDDGVLAFHSATENPNGLHYQPRASTGPNMLGMRFGLPSNTALRTAGGLVLTVAATAPTLAEARQRALANAARITFEGRSFRDDIGAQEFR